MCIIFFFLGVFYYTLGNLHPKLRSTLQSIILLTVVETKLILKYGVDVILEPFVEAVASMEKVYTLTHLLAQFTFTIH